MKNDNFHEIVTHTMELCCQCGHGDIAQQLDNALHLGSSRLEILGAIKAVFEADSVTLEKIVGRDAVDEVIKHVNEAYGIESSRGALKPES